MQRFPFIFSDERKYRLRRHFTFWLSWYLFQTFLYTFIAAESYMEYMERLPMSATESLLYLVVHMFLSYYFIYFVVPLYVLRQRYFKAAILVLAGFLVAALLSALISYFLVRPLRAYMLPGIYAAPPYPTRVGIFLALMAGLRGGITIGGLAAAIKLMKTLFMKEERNLQLQKQNVEAKLKLLQAQVHPHFLFNTLNNIYADTENKAPRAAKMVSGLSDLLRFMLYESNKPGIPLQSELKMVNDYIGLEKIRYSNNIDVHVDIPEDAGGLTIAPLLLLPLVENCFKHGSSQLIDQPWISLKIDLSGNTMDMKLMNGKPVLSTKTTGDASGIGLRNVQKRLDLIYPGRHQFSYYDEGEVFIVKLKLELNTNKQLTETKLKKGIYA